MHVQLLLTQHCCRSLTPARRSAPDNANILLRQPPAWLISAIDTTQDFFACNHVPTRHGYRQNFVRFLGKNVWHIRLIPTIAAGPTETPASSARYNIAAVSVRTFIGRPFAAFGPTPASIAPHIAASSPSCSAQSAACQLRCPCKTALEVLGVDLA
jgi:hypothetical protein